MLEKELQWEKQKLILSQPIEKFSMSIWNDRTLILRTPHPAALSGVATKAKAAALHYFKAFDQTEDINAFKASIS